MWCCRCDSKTAQCRSPGTSRPSGRAQTYFQDTRRTLLGLPRGSPFLEDTEDTTTDLGRSGKSLLGKPHTAKDLRESSSGTVLSGIMCSFYLLLYCCTLRKNTLRIGLHEPMEQDIHVGTQYRADLCHPHFQMSLQDTQCRQKTIHLRYFFRRRILGTAFCQTQG